MSHWEQFRLQCFAQGHNDRLSCAGISSANLSFSGRPAQKTLYQQWHFYVEEVSSLRLACCLPRWRRWGRRRLPARCQTLAAAAAGRGGAACRPEPRPQTAAPEPPRGRGWTAPRSPHDTGRALPLVLRDDRSKEQVSQTLTVGTVQVSDSSKYTTPRQGKCFNYVIFL